LDYPASVRSTEAVAVVAVVSSLILGSDFVLAPFYNVKLLDTLVFVTAYVFGFRLGAAVAVLSETTWSFVSPIGVAGAVAPFLVGGELLFAVAGWWASSVWSDRSKLLTRYSFFIGALMLICAFFWDAETNAATAILAFWPTLTVADLVGTEILGVPFAILHEAADFVLGLLVAPAIILVIPRMMRRRT
jgi:hypothetical protein